MNSSKIDHFSVFFLSKFHENPGFGHFHENPGLMVTAVVVPGLVVSRLLWYRVGGVLAGVVSGGVLAGVVSGLVWYPGWCPGWCGIRVVVLPGMIPGVVLPGMIPGGGPDCVPTVVLTVYRMWSTVVPAVIHCGTGCGD